MHISLYSVLAIGIFASLPAGAADTASDRPCVEVQIGQDRASQLDCLNAALQRQVQREHDTPLPEIPLGAHSSSNQLGLFNEAAAQQRMGSAYGISSVPQRPQRSFTNPLLVPR